MNKQQLITQLQSHGLKLIDETSQNMGRRGGAGPSDHRAVTLEGTTVMVPVFTGRASRSPFVARLVRPGSQIVLERDGEAVSTISFPAQPQFYSLSTAEGIPYWKIALLHSKDVLATTVLQTCMRYGNQETTCQFCAIGQSLDAGLTIARKTPEQLAEVAAAAVRLDGVKQMVMTTGTPNTDDRGAAYLRECAQAVRARVPLPLQVQCEPPSDFSWFERLRTAGVDSLGMHLEVIDPEVRARVMPAKGAVSVEYYFEAFAAAVAVFGRAQVSTYLLAGLGDDLPGLLTACERLIEVGVYPFVVPFVPIGGTALADHAPPDSDYMLAIYRQLGPMLHRAGLTAGESKAGCGKCGACSALSLFESGAS